MAEGIGKRFHKKLIWEHWEISVSLPCFKIYSFSTLRKCGAGLFKNVKTHCYITFSFFLLMVPSEREVQHTNKAGSYIPLRTASRQRMRQERCEEQQPALTWLQGHDTGSETVSKLQKLRPQPLWTIRNTPENQKIQYILLVQISSKTIWLFLIYICGSKYPLMGCIWECEGSTFVGFARILKYL